MKTLFPFIAVLSTLAACSNPIKVGLRKPAQEEYNSCQVIEEELLTEETNYSELDLNFENVKAHVFKNHCASCHFGKDAYLPHLDEYASTYSSARSGRLLKSLESGKMPPTSDMGLRDPQGMKFIKDWINKGAPL